MPLATCFIEPPAPSWEEAELVHELRNDLMALQFFIDEVDTQTASNSPVDDTSLQDARAAMARIMTMLRDLHSSDSKGVPISLHGLINKTIQAHRTLRCFIRSPDQAVIAVPVLLETVLSNLIRNASQAGARNLWFAIQPGKTTTTLSITDDGPGIPASISTRIFEPYFTTRPEGNGLGLSICARLLLRQHGSLTLDRSYSSGARFVLCLPH
jgi:signal transduction histidine kinase